MRQLYSQPTRLAKKLVKYSGGCAAVLTFEHHHGTSKMLIGKLLHVFMLSKSDFKKKFGQCRHV